jgi:ribonuclease I
MPPLGSRQFKNVLAVLALGAALAACTERDSAGPPPVVPDKQDIPGGMPAMDVATSTKPAFDFYLMAMTLHAAFCADGNADQKDCRLGSERPLVIHGLWPERLVPSTYPHDCPAPRLDLQPAQIEILQDYMPGVASGLHVHEWREHGSCSGLDADVYYEQTIQLAMELDAALSAKLTTLAGGETTGARLRAAADAYRPGLGASFTLHCRTIRGAPPELRNRPFLVEIRQCVDNDGEMGDPETLLDCAQVNRHDQGCGKSFRVAKAGR